MTETTTEIGRMTVQQILKDLELYAGRFPRKAMLAAVEQRDAVTPQLLRVLEEIAEDPAGFAARDDYMLHLFAMYLLAQFREKRAYRPLVTIFRAPGEIPFDLAGDTVTEGLAQILASVYDGDPGPLRQLVEDDNVNEYVRSAAIDAFIVLVRSGQMLLDEVVAYYRSLFDEKLTRQPSHAWNELVAAAADLPAPELLDHVRRAYADELVETQFADLAWIERELLAPGRRDMGRHKVITDAIAEMEWWATFHPEPAAVKGRSDVLAKLRKLVPAEPVPVRRVKTGRNDPCPCGSGRKYKKCCGND